jgi:hypothetical protein
MSLMTADPQSARTARGEHQQAGALSHDQSGVRSPINETALRQRHVQQEKDVFPPTCEYSD